MEDSEAKRVFRLVPVMRDFLRTFVPLEWARDVHASQLRLVSGEVHGSRDDGSGRVQVRKGDLVWEVSMAGKDDGPDLLVVLLEAQRRPDPLMALRMLEYVALQLGSRARGVVGLPPVLPIVLHTGYQSWRAPVELSRTWPETVIRPEWTPALGYLLVDVGNTALPRDHHDRNLATEVFRCLRFTGEEDVTRLLDRLMLVAELQGERWVADALAEPLGRMLARRFDRELPRKREYTMKSLKEEMKEWSFMPGPGEWREMFEEEQLKAEVSRLKAERAVLAAEAAEEERERAREKLERAQEGHGVLVKTLRRALGLMRPEMDERRLLAMSADELQMEIERLHEERGAR